VLTFKFTYWAAERVPRLIRRLFFFAELEKPGSFQRGERDDRDDGFDKTMRKLNRHLIILLLLAGVLLCICYGSERPRGVSKFDRIVVVIEENRAYSNIIGDLADAPFLNTTLVPRAAVMTNFHAEAHPSEPNYFALFAGSTFGVTDDRILQ